jgi:hypothetical protein
MIEIFKTDITDKKLADKLREALKKEFADYTINFDLDDQDRILRVEAEFINSEKIIETALYLGFSCKIIPDRLCLLKKKLFKRDA